MIPYFDVPSIEMPFGIAIHPFGVMVALGIYLGTTLASRAARRIGPGVDAPIRKYGIWLIVSGVVGAHLVHVFGYHREVLQDQGVISIFKFWDGLSSMGGILGALVAAAIVFYKQKLSLTSFLNAYALGLAPGWAVARVGCFFAHDHPGVLTNFPLAVAYPNGPRHDLGLYDFLVLIILTVILYFLSLWPVAPGRLMGVLAVGYCSSRFFLDFLRAQDLLFVDGRVYGLRSAKPINATLAAPR